MAKFEELKDLFKTKQQCIWIQADQELEVISALKAYLLENSCPILNLGIWSFHSGLANDHVANKKPLVFDKSLASIDRLSDHINEMQQTENGEPTMFILKDFHLMNDNKLIIRNIKDLKCRADKEFQTYCPIVVISPIVSIPVEHSKMFKVIKFPTPNKERIDQLVNIFVEKLKALSAKKPDIVMPTESEIAKCKSLCLGLTETEILNYLKLSTVKYKTLNNDIFLQAREDLINKTGLLKLIDTNMSMSDMGGNSVFKSWIDEVKLTLTPEAQEFGLEKSKGYVGIGVPGTSKTLSAEIVSNELNLPLLKFNIAKVMSSLVGKSEQNMEKALDLVKACSPCVLLIDEIEKTLSGMQSSAKTDGGTMARVIGGLLQFLSSEDSKDVFTVMTSNDISQMPPELTRSGRLDTIWYFGLPKEEERKEIWRIHFSKQPIEVSEEILDYATESSKNLTGAEIKEAVKVAMRKSYMRFMSTQVKEITEEDIDGAIDEIIPVYDSYKEKIKSLEIYAKTRARFASEGEPLQVASIKSLK